MENHLKAQAPVTSTVPEDLLEQFKQIAREHPVGVDAGDLISKDHKQRLADLGLVWPKYGSTFRLTDAGVEAARGLGFYRSLLKGKNDQRPSQDALDLAHEMIDKAGVGHAVEVIRQCQQADDIFACRADMAAEYALYEASIRYRVHVATQQILVEKDAALDRLIADLRAQSKPQEESEGWTPPTIKDRQKVSGDLEFGFPAPVPTQKMRCDIHVVPVWHDAAGNAPLPVTPIPVLVHRPGKESRVQTFSRVPTVMESVLVDVGRGGYEWRDVVSVRHVGSPSRRANGGAWAEITLSENGITMHEDAGTSAPYAASVDQIRRAAAEGAAEAHARLG